jgi:hypothetical protein
MDAYIPRTEQYSTGQVPKHYVGADKSKKNLDLRVEIGEL